MTSELEVKRKYIARRLSLRTCDSSEWPDKYAVYNKYG